MNCEQFENQIQQRLDNRAELALDLQLQRHARGCRHCAYTLSLYECIVVDAQLHCGPSSKRSMLSAQRVSSSVARYGYLKRFLKKDVRPQRLPQLLGAAVAAVFLMCLLPWTAYSPQPLHSLAWDTDRPTGNQYDVSQEPIVERIFQSMDVSRWFSENVSANLTNVASQIDLSGIGQVDLVAFMPKEPLYAVQMLPVALETIEPIYRYSNDLPGVNYWSSGINYTFGIIWYTLPMESEKTEQDQEDWQDLGNRIDFNLRQIC